MIAAIENFVLFSTLFALTGFALAWLARRGRLNLEAHTLARIYSVSLVFPPFVAAWIVAAAFVPMTWLDKASFNAAHVHLQHDLHLFGDITVAIEPTLAYATLAFFIAVTLFAAWSSVRGMWRIGRVIERLKMSAVAPPTEQLAVVEKISKREGINVGLVMSDHPFSFVWGFRRSKLVLSSGLLRALNAEELTGVLEHEAAHHARRDNRMKLLLSACSYASFAFPLSRLVLRWRAEEVEMVCDEVATAHTRAPLDIADALVKLRRQTLSPTLPTTVASGFVPDDVPSFERRVHRLVRLADAVPDGSRAAKLSCAQNNYAVALTAFFAASILLLSFVAPLAIHHAAESIIHIIK